MNSSRDGKLTACPGTFLFHLRQLQPLRKSPFSGSSAGSQSCADRSWKVRRVDVCPALTGTSWGDAPGSGLGWGQGPDFQVTSWSPHQLPSEVWAGPPASLWLLPLQNREQCFHTHASDLRMKSAPWQPQVKRSDLWGLWTPCLVHVCAVPSLVSRVSTTTLPWAASPLTATSRARRMLTCSLCPVLLILTPPPGQ